MTSIDALIGFVNNCMTRNELSGEITLEPEQHSLKQFVSLFSRALYDEKSSWKGLTYTSAEALLVCFDTHDAMLQKGLVEPLSDKEWNMASLPVYTICNTTSSLVYKMTSSTTKLLWRCLGKLDEIHTTQVLEWDSFSTVCPLVRASLSRSIRDCTDRDSESRSVAAIVLKKERGKCKDVVPEVMYNLLCFMDALTDETLGIDDCPDMRGNVTNDFVTLFDRPSTLGAMPFHIQNYAFTDILLPLAYQLSGTQSYPRIITTVYNYVVEYLHLVPIRLIHSFFRALMNSPSSTTNELHHPGFVTSLSKMCAFYLVFVWEDGSWKPEYEHTKKSDTVDMGVLWHIGFAQVLSELPTIKELMADDLDVWTPFIRPFVFYAERKTECTHAFARLALLTAYTSACFKGVRPNGEELISSFMYTVMTPMSRPMRKEFVYNCIKRLESNMPKDYVKRLTLSNCSTLNEFFDASGLYEGILMTVRFYMSHAIHYFTEFLSSNITSPSERIKKILSHDWTLEVSLEQIVASDKAFEEICKEEELHKHSRTKSNSARAKKKRAEERRAHRKQEKKEQEGQKLCMEKKDEKERMIKECDRKVLSAIDRARKDIACGGCIKDSMDRVTRVVVRYHNWCSSLSLKEKDAFRKEFGSDKTTKPPSHHRSTLLVLSNEEELRLSETLHNVEMEDATTIGITKEIERQIKEAMTDADVRKRLSQQRVVEVSRCPITMCVMEDPTVASDGHTYERSAIMDWMSRNDTSPLTGDIFTHNHLVTNYAFRSVMDIVI
jgi:hypothetical protein